MKAMIAIPALCLAMHVAADCPVTHPRQAPVLPTAATASEEEMHRTRLAAEQYLLQGRAYLECGLMNRRQYNQLLSQLEMFAERYNEELTVYQNARLAAEVNRAAALEVTESSAD